MQNSGPWDPWLPLVKNSRLFAQRTVRPLRLQIQPHFSKKAGASTSLLWVKAHYLRMMHFKLKGKGTWHGAFATVTRKVCHGTFGPLS